MTFENHVSTDAHQQAKLPGNDQAPLSLLSIYKECGPHPAAAANPVSADGSISFMPGPSDQTSKNAGQPESQLCKALDNPPTTYEQLQHMNLIQNGRFTQEGLTAITDYIQNGSSELLDPRTWSQGGRASVVQSLINSMYATGSTVETLNGTQHNPPMYSPFTVNFTAGYHSPNGDHADSIYHPPTLTISQTVDGRQRTVASQ